MRTRGMPPRRSWRYAKELSGSSVVVAIRWLLRWEGNRNRGHKAPGSPSITLSRSGVLGAELVEVLLAVGGHFPRLRPEAQVHTPPVVRHASLQKRRGQLVEVQFAGAERVVRRGVVLVQAAVAVDDVDVSDLSLELVEQFD